MSFFYGGDDKSNFSRMIAAASEWQTVKNTVWEKSEVSM